jgi:hypothetical protein
MKWKTSSTGTELMTRFKHIIYLGFLLTSICLIQKSDAGMIDRPSGPPNGVETSCTNKLLSGIGELENISIGPLLRHPIASSAQPDIKTVTNTEKYLNKADIKPQITILIIGYSALTIAWFHSGKYELYSRKI